MYQNKNIVFNLKKRLYLNVFWTFKNSNDEEETPTLHPKIMFMRHWDLTQLSSIVNVRRTWIRRSSDVHQSSCAQWVGIFVFLCVFFILLVRLCFLFMYWFYFAFSFYSLFCIILCLHSLKYMYMYASWLIHRCVFVLQQKQ